MIPPDVESGGVTELRVHGVGGTTPQSLLGDLAPQQVAGNRIAGFYRTADRTGSPDRGGRHVEAYSWGGLTSRSGTRVLWALLLPFALANLAGWMCSPKVHGSRKLFWLHRATVRWAAFAITINFLLVAAITAMDLIGYQCGGQQRCVDGRWWLAVLEQPWIFGFPGRRVLVGALLPLAIVLLFVGLTWRSAGRYEQVPPPYKEDEDAPGHRTAGPVRSERGAAVAGRGLAHPEFWDGSRSTRRGGWLHVGGGLAFVALVVVHTVRQAVVAAGIPVTAGWLADAGFGLAVAAIAAALALLTAETFAGARAPWVVFGAAVLALLAGAVFAAVQPAFGQGGGWLPGMRQVSRLTFVALLIVVGLVLMATLLGGRERGAFLGGPFAAVGAAVFVLNLVLHGVMIQVADLLTSVSFSPALEVARAGQSLVYIDETVGRSTPYFLAVLVIVVVFGVVTWVRCRLAGLRSRIQERVRRDYVGSEPPPGAHERWWYTALTAAARRSDAQAQPSESDRKWLAGIARVWCWADAPRSLDVALVVVAAGAVVVLCGLTGSIAMPAPATTQAFVGVGSAVIAWAPLGLLLLVRRGWSNLESRRRLGVLWDVGTFWPRSYHPLAPPSYAERAVPELQRRLWYLHDQEGSVVLVAHSQGSVIAAAAALQGDGQRPPDRRMALVTFGAPLRKLYGWTFPAYFSDDVLRVLADLPASRLSAWRNFHYPTDVIGGPALAGAPAGVDRRLRDPASVWHVYGQPLPAPEQHSGYWTDPRVWHEVDHLAAGLSRHSLGRAGAEDEQPVG